MKPPNRYHGRPCSSCHRPLAELEAGFRALPALSVGTGWLAFIIRQLALRLLIVSLALSFTSCCCFGTPPGKGRQAKAGFRAAAPVILALEQFHKDHGSYPVGLNELVPRYLPDAAALLVRGKVEPLHSPRARSSAESNENSYLDRFSYARDADGYRLSFSYTGPGMNTCEFDSRTKQWNSHGYY
jgi:hypothetical protein